jgi:NADPH:quinone reductase-like Zn-dependent oxidoreductase
MREVIVREHGPFRSPRMETVPDPVPGPGEVVIDALARFAERRVQGKMVLLP